MPGPAALIALAARLGIPKAAKLVAEKGFKYLQKRIAKAQKKKTTKQTEAEKGYRGQGSKRQQEKVNKRKAKIRSTLKEMKQELTRNTEKRKLASKIRTDLEISKKKSQKEAWNKLRHGKSK